MPRDAEKYSWAEPYRDPPRVPRERLLSTGGMYWMTVTVGLIVYGAGYLVWGWLHS